MEEKNSFFTDVEEIRRRAREHIRCSALTADDPGDAQLACQVLNEALATEIVCTLRYWSHYDLTEGIHADSVKEEFAEHAREEQSHADRLAERIKQLGGKPDLHPEGILTLSHAESHNGETLVELIEEDLVAERVAIESYREMANYFTVSGDFVSRKLMEEILENEEEHAEELASFLLTLAPDRQPINPDAEAA
jgi:bacterioferritin